jgi:hypothetical protein
MNRIPCKRCNAMILEATANANGGLCASCNKGGGICEQCGTRMSRPNKHGKYLCWDCDKAQRFGSLPFLPKGWNKLSDVDWSLISKNYTIQADDLLRQFRSVQGSDPVYGLLFQLSQDGIFDIYINTQSGIDGIPEKMRKIANWGGKLNDAEWIEKVGLWFATAWKFAPLSSDFESEFGRTIDDFHYDLFESLYRSATDSESSELVVRKFDEARLSAIESIKNSEAFTGILKTQDFASYVVDDEGLQYHTKAPVGG